MPRLLWTWSLNRPPSTMPVCSGLRNVGGILNLAKWCNNHAYLTHFSSETKGDGPAAYVLSQNRQGLGRVNLFTWEDGMYLGKNENASRITKSIYCRLRVATILFHIYGEYVKSTNESLASIHFHVIQTKHAWLTESRILINFSLSWHRLNLSLKPAQRTRLISNYRPSYYLSWASRRVLFVVFTYSW